MKPIHKKFIIIISILWCCSFTSLFGVYLCLIAPQNEILSFLENKLEKKQLELEYTKQANSNQAITKWNRQLEDLRDKLSKYIVETGELNNLTVDISEIADKIKVGTFTSKEVGDEPYLPIVNYSFLGDSQTNISFKSSFNKFVRFINLLERHKPAVFIDSLLIERSRKDNLKNEVSVSLSVLVRLPMEDVDDSS